MYLRAAANLKRIASFMLFAALASATAHAAGIGVVLLHAGSSWPGQFENLGPRLEAAGYGQVAPQTCWTVNRLYGGTVEECQADIDKAVATLREKGYDRIVVAGHDLGALVALYYADSHPELVGVVVWGPRMGGRGGSDVDIDNAMRLMSEGAGNKKADFSNGYVYTTPRALLSFRGPDSPLADEAALLAKISAPLLWIDANDTLGPRDPTPRFNLAPAKPLNTFIRSTTDHFAMVDKSADDLIAWLGKMKSATPQ